MKPNKHLILLCAILFGIFNSFANPIASLDDDDPIIFLGTVKTEEVCGLSNGTLTINASGGSTGELYYSIDGGINYQTENFFDGLESGDYLIFISDGSGAYIDKTTQIGNAPLPKVDMVVNCVDGKNLSKVDLVPFAGGVSPFTYEWEGPNNTTHDTEDLSDIKPGDYKVTITDRLGCTVDTTLFIPICCEMEIACVADTVYLDCLSAISTVDARLLNNDSDNGEMEALADMIDVTIKDACSPVVIRLDEKRLDPTTCDNQDLIIERHFEIMDGNTSSTCSQFIVVDNFTEVELLQEAENLMVSCDDDIQLKLDEWMLNNGGAAFKTCHDDFTVSVDPPLAELLYTCEGTGEIDVTFSITDGCGSNAYTHAQFSVRDITPPEIECPEAITISNEDFSAEGIPEAWVNTLYAEDNCSSAQIEMFDQDLENFVDCEASELSIQFIAIDDCGNESDCISKITVTSTVIPEINCPAPLVVQCHNIDESRVTEWLSETSVLGAITVDYLPAHDFDMSVLYELSCNESTEVNFSMEVCEVNVACSARISVEDQVRPTISCPEKIILYFDDANFDDQLDAWLDLANATDNCTSARLSNDLDKDFSSLICEESYMVEFTAKDDCDNINDCMTSFIVRKNNPVIIQCPELASFHLDDEDLEAQIMDHLSSVDVDSDLSFDMTHDFDMSLVNLESPNIYTLDINFDAVNFCNDTDYCASIIRLIPPPRVYIPNVFTPETNDRNNCFTAYTNDAVIMIKTMLVYNRWGDKVFEKYDFLPNDNDEAWDGTYFGKVDQAGVYTYYIIVEDLEGLELEYSGSVHMLK